jgi:hypothetical protein
MYDTLRTYNGGIDMIVVQILIALVAVKAMTIGSEFNCYLWLKHGKAYREWYFNKDRTTFPGKTDDFFVLTKH